eukprot:3594023-Prymnesium_polylepis.1
MGASSSAPVFSSEELDVYEACTCLSAAEILELYDKFCKAGGERAPPTSHEKHLRGRRSDTPQPQRTDAEVGGEDAEGGKKAKIADIVKQKEFLYNPFAQRLCRIFTSVCKAARQRALFAPSAVSSRRPPTPHVLTTRVDAGSLDAAYRPHPDAARILTPLAPTPPAQEEDKESASFGDLDFD